LIIVALVVAWLLVLVPIAARRRQEVAKTADSTLAARVVRSGGVSAKVEEAFTMSEAPAGDTDSDHKFTAKAEAADLDDFDATDFDDADDVDDVDDLDDRDDLDDLDDVDDLDDIEEEDLDQLDSALDDTLDEDEFDDEDLEPDGLDAAASDAAEYDTVDEYADRGYADEYTDDYDEDAPDGRRSAANRSRPYRPGRGGFDPAAAAASARVKYAIRQRIVLLIIVLAITTAVLAVVTKPVIWWAQGILDIGLVSYLSYLRRQVRIEDEIRQRRTARLGPESHESAYREDSTDYDAERDYREADRYDAPPAPRATLTRPVARPRPRPGTVVVETDDDDPIFDDLEQPDILPYRRAVGE
jgi:hypothetical protein